MTHHTRIQVQENSGTRLVLHLSPTFTPFNVVALIAIVAGAIMCAYVWSWLFRAGGNQLGWLAYALCGVNGLLVLGIFVFFLRIRFTRFLLCLEPGRFVLQRLFFSANKTTSLATDSHSRATLVRVARENGRPIHAVKISGTTRTMKFGVGLIEEDKRQVVELVNAFFATTSAVSSFATADSSESH